MIKKATVISIVSSHYEVEQVMSLNTNLAKAGYAFKVVLLLNGTMISDNVLSSFDKSIDIKFLIEPFELSHSAALNELLRETDSELVCYIASNVYLDSNWLREMVKYHSLVDRSGIALISHNKKGYYTSVLTENGDIESVVIPDAFSESDCFIFAQQLIYELGAFDENIHSGFQIENYAERSYRTGHQNFIIPNQNIVDIGFHNHSPWKTDEDFYKQNYQKKRTAVYIQLSEMDISLSTARLDLNHLKASLYAELSKSFSKAEIEIQDNEKLGNFGLLSFAFTAKQIKLISTFARQNKISYYMIPYDQQVQCVFTIKN